MTKYVLALAVLLASTSIASADDSPFDYTPEILEQQIEAYVQHGWHKPKSTIAGKLDAFKEIKIPVEKGRCYLLVLRLGNKAAWSEHARGGVAFVFRQGKKTFEKGILSGPGGLGLADCMSASGTLVFDLQATAARDTNPSTIHDLGTGSFTIEVWHRTTAEKVAADKKFSRDNAREAREHSARYNRKGCATCQEERIKCDEGTYPPRWGTCGKDYSICLDRRGLSRSTCGN